MDMNKKIPPNYSPVRFMVSEAQGVEYKPLSGYHEALTTPNAVLIMEGDWGGQIYLTCPMGKVKCSEKTLHLLLSDLDQIAWKCNEGEGKGIFYEVRQSGDPIHGGMGGGFILWVHDEFEVIRDRIYDVISGLIDRL